PGPGLGGHCIPIDPYYLSWMARKYDFETNFITLSARVNEEMPHYVVDAVMQAVASQPVRLREAKVLILGAAFKKNVDDTRHSPTLKLMELLGAAGFDAVDYSDPFVPSLAVPAGGQTLRRESVPLTPETVRAYDVVVLVTDHGDFPYEMIAREAKWIVDTRNAFAHVEAPSATIRVLGGGHF
ncbi:UDP binding domain-containing protein, partial [Rhodocaloribacter sp.]